MHQVGHERRFPEPHQRPCRHPPGHSPPPERQDHDDRGGGRGAVGGPDPLGRGLADMRANPSVPGRARRARPTNTATAPASAAVHAHVGSTSRRRRGIAFSAAMPSTNSGMRASGNT